MIIRVQWFDGILACVRECVYLGCNQYIVKDRYSNGSERILFKNGQYIFGYQTALNLMEEVMQNGSVSNFRQF